MVQDIRNHFAEIEKHVEAANTEFDDSAPEVPDYMKLIFVEIRPDRGDTEEVFFKKFILLSRSTSYSPWAALMILGNWISMFDKKFKTAFSGLLTKHKVTVLKRTITEFKISYAEEVDWKDLKDLDKMEAPHYVFAICLSMNLIGKSLNDDNYTDWMSKRFKSYAIPLGLEADDSLLAYIQPSQAYCRQLYNNARSFWEIRRRLFVSVVGFAKSAGLLQIGGKIVLVLLRGSELTNFNFIRNWILVLNPELLCWNEMAKYIPFIQASVSKYNEIGDWADYCKLILPPEELTEFVSPRLRVPYTIARALAVQYDNPNIIRVKGETVANAIKAITRQALRITRVAGGANTIDTEAIRALRFGHLDNEPLYTELKVGANMEEEDDLANNPTDPQERIRPLGLRH